MSLINDALKQARQSQQPDQPSGVPPLRPVASPPRGAGDWLLPLAVIALVVAAAFFIGVSLFRHKPATAAKAPEILAVQPAPPPPATPPPVIAPITNAPAISNATPAVPPPPPSPKLQGIVYGQKSWAIVDGKTVNVGDSVGNSRVVEISPNSITLENRDGSRKKLGLGE